MKYGECPPGESYAWEQVLCDESVTNTSTASTPSTFDSFTVFELFHGQPPRIAGMGCILPRVPAIWLRTGPDADQEEKGLATKQLHRKLAPQVTGAQDRLHTAFLARVCLLTNGSALQKTRSTCTAPSRTRRLSRPVSIKRRKLGLRW